jgi:hypothetical protein
MPGIFPGSFGYGIEENNFILYLPFLYTTNDGHFIDATYDSATEKPLVIGQFIDHTLESLTFLPYSVDKINNHVSDSVLKYVVEKNTKALAAYCGTPQYDNDKNDPEFTKYIEVSSAGELLPKGPYTNWYSAWGEYLKTKGFLVAK